MESYKNTQSSETGERKRVPIVEGLFTMPSSPDERPQLIGSRCKACGEVFCPKRLICAHCYEQDAEEISLSGKGKLYTYTIIRAPVLGYQGPIPFVVGQIELPEGLTIQSILTGCEPERLEIGMPMEITLGKLEEDEAGNEIVTYMFKPAVQ
jgi:uncharacterized OB-fold protein